jgi:colicin import membrane protein
MRFCGWLGSFLLHLVIFVLVLYSPSGSKRIRIDLNRPVYEVELINLLPPEPVQKSVQKKVEKLTSQVKKNELKLPSRREEKPLKQKKPEPSKKVKKIKSPHKARKPKVPLKDTKKISSRKIKKPEKTEAKRKKEPSAQEILAKALGSVKKQVRKKQKSEKMILASELAGLRQKVKQGKAGVTQGKAGLSGSSGLIAIYVRIAEEKIKKNWRFPRIGVNDDLIVQVEIVIDEKGKIIQSKIVKSSGRRDFDLSALKAIQETGFLPPPPARNIDKLIINFNLLELS